MTRCKNDTLISKIGLQKLQKTTEIDFSVSNYLPDCRRILAKKMLNTVAASFDPYAVPANQFECVREGCVNTGTLFNAGAATLYKARWDAVDFAGGIITLYTVGSEGTLTLKIGEADTLADADVYTVDLSKLETGADGYKAVVVDLSQNPASTVGNGWTPNHVAAYISIAITKATGESDDAIGISSIAVYDSLDDFESTAAVRMECASTVGGSWDFEAVEATCFGNGGIDDESIDSFEMTITAKAVTPNYMKLHPMIGKGNATTGWDTETVEKVVEAGTGDNEDYGVVVLPDKSADECGFISVARADNCNVTDAHLVELIVPNRVVIDQKHFFVIDNEDGSAMVYVNKDLVGQTVIISYPQEVEVEEEVFDVDNVRYKKTRASYTRTYTDGTKYRYVFDNVIVTSFPDEVTDEETEFEFTITIQKDASGVFGRRYRIVG